MLTEGKYLTTYKNNYYVFILSAYPIFFVYILYNFYLDYNQIVYIFYVKICNINIYITN